MGNMPKIQDVFREGLERFTHGRDDFDRIRMSAPPTLDGIGTGEVVNRTSFSRGTFEPNSNVLTQALAESESGDDALLLLFLSVVRQDPEMEKRFHELEVRADPLPGGNRFINEIIVLHRGDIASLLGIKRS